MRSLALALVLAATAAPALARGPAPTPTPLSPLAHRGFVTDRATAERAIVFSPFLPDPAPVGVALEPPFHGGQVSANEGIAYAYTHRDRTWLLSEWPRNGGSLAAFPTKLVAGIDPRCGEIHAVGGATRPRGVVWATPHGLVMALRPDGVADPRTVLAEFRRLVRRGACR